MKNLKLFAFAACLAATVGTMAADDYVYPIEWPEVYAQKVSPNGRFVAAQDIFFITYVYDLEADEIIPYEAAYAGDGQYVADDGTMVGEDALLSMPVIMKDGKVIVPDAVKSYGYGCFESITPDARMAAGFVGIPYTPCVYNLETETLEILPAPERDLAGGTPQGVIPHVISDDGRTVAGVVMDDTGMHEYPIIFRRADDGSWSYSLPTQDMPLSSQSFGGAMAISPDGKYMITLSMTGFPLTPWIFDTEDDSYRTLPANKGNLIPTQILADGTVLAVSYAEDFLPYTAYMFLPGAEDFILFTDWLQDNIPEYYPWLEDELGQYNIVGYDDDGQPIYDFYIITGQISVSEGYSTIAGGLPIGDFLSYIYYDPDGEYHPSSGVKAPEVQTVSGAEPGVWYNLQGMPVSNPSKGIFIRDGKKVLLP